MQGRHNNNFHLLRLLAAGQVAVSHTASHMGIAMPQALQWISAFPGVPIFFVISGFLVSESFDRQPLGAYAVNRLLRIYPGLWGCLAVSIGIALVWGDVHVDATWIAAQATIAQFWNPAYLRDFGVGVLNGSLWTIPVELQFYAALPLLAWCVRSNRALIGAIALGAIVNGAYFAWGTDSFAQKLAGVTLAPYLYMFLIGTLLQRNRALVTRALAGRLPLWLAVYAAIEIAANAAGLRAVGNFLNPISAIALGLLVISAAYARAIPLRQDFSYGLYLYHMPVANAFIASGAHTWAGVGASIGVAMCLAIGSWFLIERPALQLKHYFAAFGKRDLTSSTRARISST